jgi:hypothetical protein
LQAGEALGVGTKKVLEGRLGELKDLELQLRKRNIELKGDIAAQNLVKSDIINKIDTYRLTSI